MVAEVLAAVVVAQAEPGGDARPVAAVVRPQPLAERLARLEARAGASRVDADALGALFLTSAGQRMASAGTLEVVGRQNLIGAALS